MKGFLQLFRSKRGVASITALTLIAGVPTTVAVLHQGFPTTEVDLQTSTVWVTNGTEAMGGRLNDRIHELDAAVTGSSSHLDVLQDGGAYFLVDTVQGVLDRIDPAYVSLVDRVQIPVGSQVSYGANTLAVLSPKGQLWVLDASNRLQFDHSKTRASAKLGSDARVVVSKSGRTFALSPEKKALVEVTHPGAKAQSASFDVPKDAQLSAVGDEPVVLDPKSKSLMTRNGTKREIPGAPLKLQQPGEAADSALVATATGLVTVPLGGGEPTVIDGDIDSTVTGKQTSAPVWLNGCAYGAWAGAARYVYACEGQDPVRVDIGQPVAGDDLEFRVNHGVIALNNLRDGNAWVVTSEMRLVQNWSQLKPENIDKQSEDGEEKPVKQSFADAIAERTENNRPPTAVDDVFGVRPGRTTVLPVTANDIDPDGDVLTVTSVTPIPEDQGHLDLVEGGRSVQFTPTENVSGTISFRYTIDDGRGGTASAQTNATIVPLDVNTPPKEMRTSAVDVELGQSISYPALGDWLDPDGDDIYLVGASSTTGDDVRFSADGTVTFTSKSGQTGSKEVAFTVSDGRADVSGTLRVTVNPPGTLDPIAVPDSGYGPTNTAITVKALENDRSPSGAPLALADAALAEGVGASVTTDNNAGSVTLTSANPGTYYVEYSLTAGDRSTKGLIRFDVVEVTDNDAPPVAVKDIAYIRPGESVRVPVLANDVSPSGRVLVVQDVDKGDDADALNVEVLGNAVVRVTAPTVLTSQVQLSYTISDGYRSSRAGITIVPIPPLVVHQPPVALDDSVVVRAGDIVTVPVLDNDYSPDDATFTLDREFVSTENLGDGAAAFVNDDTVRFHAPDTAGQYSVTYSITDKFDQKATAIVTFMVTARDSKTNRAPVPPVLTARAFSGSTVNVVVPLDGIDPDGDSVLFSGIEGQPASGRIVSSTAEGFTYEAYPGSFGTDTFRYKVVDTYGVTAEGTVNIGIVPRPATVKPPTAVNDMVEVKPGKTASIAVLANDSDPNGFPISLEKKLPEVQKGLGASVHGSIVLVTAPKQEGVFVARYRITNGHGGQATAFVQVVVTEEATPRYPTARDHLVETAEVASKGKVTVDVLSNALNPSGLASGLDVSVSGANANAATVESDGTVVVTPSDKRMAITFGVTDPDTGLTGQAFIVVPPKPRKNEEQPRNPRDNEPTKTPEKPLEVTAPPHIKAGLTDQIVPMNGTGSWSLSEIIEVPSKRPATLSGKVTASNGEVTAKGDSGFTFKPKKDYRGPVTITFSVNDGKEEGAKEDRITPLALSVLVGKPDQTDIAPTFTTSSITIEAGEEAIELDLRDSTYHPNEKELEAITYSKLEGATKEIVAQLSGSKLRVSAPFGVQPGTKATLEFSVTSSEFTIPGAVKVSVVSSTRPIAMQKNAPQVRETKRGQSVDVENAVGTDSWVNPFPGQPLRITDAKASSAPAGVTVSHTATSITVSTSSGASIGSVNITYTVEDATKDPARTKQTIGQVRVTIHDVPAKPQRPDPVVAGDGFATMKIMAPADNGKPIDQYRIEYGGTSKTFNAAGLNLSNIRIDGLTNGTSYSFKVAARNVDGWGPVSESSASVTPYGTPQQVGQPTISASGYGDKNGGATLSMSWPPLTGAATGGGAVTYEYRINGGGWVSANGSTSASTGGAKAGSYYVEVRAINNGSGKPGNVSARSNAVTVNNAPPPPPPPPPPSPSASVVKGAKSPWAPGYHVCASYSNVPNGSYTITQLLNGGHVGGSSVSTHTLSGSGTVCGQSSINVASGGATIQVHFVGAGHDFYATTSGSGWNSLPVTGNRP